MEDINSVILAARLTRDPELRQLPSGLAVCDLRVAFNVREKVGEDWQDVGQFINATVWGRQGESVARYLSKGSQVILKGGLRHRTWEQQTEGGTVKREAHGINVERIQFVGGRQDGDSNGFSGPREVPVQQQGDPQNAPADDDIPF